MKTITFILTLLFFSNAFAALPPYEAKADLISQMVKSEAVKQAVETYDNEHMLEGIQAVEKIREDLWRIKTRACMIDVFVSILEAQGLEDVNGNFIMGPAQYSFYVPEARCLVIVN